MIREMLMSDLDIVMDIWLNTNISAHEFVKAEYWQNNYDEVKAAIQNAEVYVYESAGEIKGFIGVVENYIAGLFVEQQFQSMGIGSKLLAHVKMVKSSLVLSVYEENKAAVDFYIKQGFSICSKNIDDDTGHVEYEMLWENARKG